MNLRSELDLNLEILDRIRLQGTVGSFGVHSSPSCLVEFGVELAGPHEEAQDLSPVYLDKRVDGKFNV